MPPSKSLPSLSMGQGPSSSTHHERSPVRFPIRPYIPDPTNRIFRPITEEEFFDAVEEELDKRDQMEQESNESNRLKQQAVTPNEHHSQSVGLDFKIRVSRKFCIRNTRWLPKWPEWAVTALGHIGGFSYRCQSGPFPI